MSFATSRVFGACRALLAPAKTAAKSATTQSKPKAAPKPKKATTGKTGGGGGGLQKPLPVSPALRDFVGTPEASRAETVKKIWAHIKEHNLQNPTDKKEIFCDAKLKVLFEGREKVNFLEIGKLLSRHFIKTT